MVNRKEPWRCGEYDEMGGYDCMYPSIPIYEGNKVVTTLDGRDRGDIDACTEPTPEAKQAMIDDAKFIVTAANAHGYLMAAAEQALSDLLWIESVAPKSNFQSTILLLRNAIGRAHGIELP